MQVKIDGQFLRASGTFHKGKWLRRNQLLPISMEVDVMAVVGKLEPPTRSGAVFPFFSLAYFLAKFKVTGS